MSLARFRLRQNKNISRFAYWRAAQLRKAIADAVDKRDDYIREKRLDPAFCLPDANWGPDSRNDFLQAYRHVRDGGYDVVNRLRFFCQVFSGYNLMSLHNGPGFPSVRPIPDDYDPWIEKTRPEPDFSVESWYVLEQRIPAEYLFRPPAMLGEIGWFAEGTILNFDTLTYQERITILFDSGILRWLASLGRKPRILEIGGGYGALAYALAPMVDAETYVICDLPESLLFSGLYLRLTRPWSRVGVAEDAGAPRDYGLLPNYRFGELMRGGAKFDLVINTLSMSEMSELQVRGYCEGIRALIGETGIFFEQNQDNRPGGLIDAKTIAEKVFAHRARLTHEPRMNGFADAWFNQPSLQTIFS